MVDRQRVRIRFRKEGDLRLTGHLDLLRLFERLFRRAELKLRMSEGFHPKPKISFPSALALGVRGLDEVMELELTEAASADELLGRLAPQCPEGLVITDVVLLPADAKKAQVQHLVYEIRVPEDRQAETRSSVEELSTASSRPIKREGREEPIDVCESLASIQLDGDVLRFSLKTTRTASVRPRDILAELGLGGLEDEGFYLTRTAVQIAPLTEKSELS